MKQNKQVTGKLKQGFCLSSPFLLTPKILLDPYTDIPRSHSCTATTCMQGSLHIKNVNLKNYRAYTGWTLTKSSTRLGDRSVRDPASQRPYRFLSLLLVALPFTGRAQLRFAIRQILCTLSDFMTLTITEVTDTNFTVV